jgi:hypothetical protein
VEIGARGQAAAAQGSATREPVQRGLAGAREATSLVDDSLQLASQKGGDGDSLLRGNEASLAKDVLVQGQGDVAFRCHADYV